MYSMFMLCYKKNNKISLPLLGLYRSYFLPIWPEQVIWVFDGLLCSSYCYDFLNFSISYLFRPTRLSYYSSKLYNVWEKSTSQIRQNYPAPVGFLPEPDFCEIWKKCRIPARAGAKIWYSPSLYGYNVSQTSKYSVELTWIATWRWQMMGDQYRTLLPCRHL